MENLHLTTKRQEIVKMMGFDSTNSILRYYPYRYDIYKDDELSFDKHDSKVSIQGVISSLKPKVEYLPNKLNKITITVNHQGIDVKVIFFMRLYSYAFLNEGNSIVLIGKYNAFNNEITVSNFFMGKINGKEKLVPVYSTPSSVKDAQYKTFIKHVIKENYEHNYIKEIIPTDFKTKYHLIPLYNALEYIHNPRNSEDLKQAKRYLKYEEFLTFCACGYLKRKMLSYSGNKNTKVVDYQLINTFIKSLPFSLTKDQKMVVDEIIHDMQSNVNMSRLLQGDVGSGKTIVGLIAAIASFSCGYQSAIMAPTDILARQHYQEIKERLKDFNINVGLLVADMKNKEKDEILENLKNQKIDIIVGTHSLISSNVIYKKLGLAIIDEQHRFGVRQRVMLKEKGDNVDVLYMSATPIPRTLASTIYMDMDVSTLQTFPYKERKVKTYYLENNDISKIKDFVLQYLKTGQQIYIICPSIENSKKDLATVKNIYKEWENKFNDYKVALLHGKLKADEKAAIMEDFSNGKIDILVSTTVIEVGINVKNANMMIIYNAERFGLATIHQLRGRIGRYGKTGYCYLLSDNEDENAKERLKFLQDNEDGFKIAEFDLKNRGAGDMLGTMQAGKSPFVISNLIDDFAILKEASKDVRYIMTHPEIYHEFIDYINDFMVKQEQYVD